MEHNLAFWDTVLLWAHIMVITFNLTGWIWEKARKLHLVVVAGTLFSWIVLGLRYGMGYCFLTDWHWDVKYQLGETDLPASFIKYFFDRYTPFDIAANVVDWGTGITFGVVVLITIYVNFMKKR